MSEKRVMDVIVEEDFVEFLNEALTEGLTALRTIERNHPTGRFRMLFKLTKEGLIGMHVEPEDTRPDA